MAADSNAADASRTHAPPLLEPVVHSVSPRLPVPEVAEILRSLPGRRYALLDAARGPRVLRCLQTDERSQTLYEGAPAEDLADVAPYLVELDERSLVLDHWIANGWGDSWGMLLTADVMFQDLRRHLRHFLRVQLEGGSIVFFRFYDPRVMRIFLPTCDAQQLGELFGPVRAFLMEGEERGQALVFGRRREWERGVES